MLDAVEQDLIRLCERFGRGWAVYVMPIDTRGIREYYVYNGPGASLADALPGLLSIHPEYRIEYDETTEADWSRYRAFLPQDEPKT
jgi:hypothetical protein